MPINCSCFSSIPDIHSVMVKVKCACQANILTPSPYFLPRPLPLNTTGGGKECKSGVDKFEPGLVQELLIANIRVEFKGYKGAN